MEKTEDTNFCFSLNMSISFWLRRVWSRTKILSTSGDLSVAMVFLRQASQCFASLRLENGLESRSMLLPKALIGFNWHEELPNDLDNSGDRLEGMSPEDCRSIFLYGSALKWSQLLGVIVLHLRSLGSDEKSPFKTGKWCGSCLCHFSIVAWHCHCLLSMLSLLSLL